MDDLLARQAHRDYLESRVFSAHPAERVLMLYQIAIDSVKTAIARLKDGDIFARGGAVNKAHEAVDELNLALDHSVGAIFTHRLAELYSYVQRQLVKGHSQKSEQAFQEALSVLETLAEAWKEVVARTSGAGSSLGDAHAEAAESPAEEMVPEKPASDPYAAYTGVPGVEPTSRDWSC